MIAKGFVYFSPEGDMVVNTVGDSKRSTKINAVIITTKGCVMPARGWSEDAIDKAFETYCGLGLIVAVTVQAHEG